MHLYINFFQINSLEQIYTFMHGLALIARSPWGNFSKLIKVFKLIEYLYTI